jgi:hypothetical protein
MAPHRFTMLKRRNAIRRNGSEVLLGPRQFSILQRIAHSKLGISPEQIFDAEYAADPNGGPLTGRHSVVVQRTVINRKISTLGLKIVASKNGGGAVYTLEIARDPSKKVKVETSAGNVLPAQQQELT